MIFLVNATVEGFHPKSWLVEDKYSSDALALVLDALGLADANIRISSRPATEQEQATFPSLPLYERPLKLRPL